VVFLWILGDVFNFGVDDTYIFFRYAQNVSGGHGFVFNAGEMPGEGFTSWLWLLILSFTNLLGLAPILTSKVLGLMCLLSASFFFYLTISRLFKNNTSAKISAVILTAAFCFNYRMIAHSVSGMETSLYVLAVTILLYILTSALQAEAHDYKWWLILSLCTTGLFLVRPEGAALGGLSLLIMAIRHPRALLKLKPWLYGVLGLLFPISIFLVWKTIYFGYTLPLSYYHKVIVQEVEYGESFRHLMLFVKSYLWLLILAVIMVFYSLRKLKNYMFLYFLLIFLAIVSLYLLFYPAMNYLHRFYIPYLSFLLIMVSPGVFLSIEKIKGFRRPWLQVSSSLVLLALFVFTMNIHALSIKPKTPRYRVKSWTKMVDPQKTRAKLGMLMSRLPRQVVVANTEMGVIPYYSGLTCLDMAGLTDPYTAHHGVSMDYLVKRKTDLILFNRNAGKMVPKDWDKYTHPYGSVFLSQQFVSNYVNMGKYFGYFIYANKQSPYFEEIRTWIKTYSRELALKPEIKKNSR